MESYPVVRERSNYINQKPVIKVVLKYQFPLFYKLSFIVKGLSNYIIILLKVLTYSIKVLTDIKYKVDSHKVL